MDDIPGCSDTKTKPKRWTWTKPEGKPKRPLSAYNLYFAYTRKRLQGQRSSPHAREQGPNFKSLALIVAEGWKIVKTDPALLAPFKQQAQVEQARYKAEIELWQEDEAMKKLIEESSLEATNATNPAILSGGSTVPSNHARQAAQPDREKIRKQDQDLHQDQKPSPVLDLKPNQRADQTNVPQMQNNSFYGGLSVYSDRSYVNHLNTLQSPPSRDRLQEGFHMRRVASSGQAHANQATHKPRNRFFQAHSSLERATSDPLPLNRPVLDLTEEESELLIERLCHPLRKK